MGVESFSKYTPSPETIYQALVAKSLTLKLLNLHMNTYCEFDYIFIWFTHVLYYTYSISFIHRTFTIKRYTTISNHGEIYWLHRLLIFLVVLLLDIRANLINNYSMHQLQSITLLMSPNNMSQHKMYAVMGRRHMFIDSYSPCSIQTHTIHTYTNTNTHTQTPCTSSCIWGNIWVP